MNKEAKVARACIKVGRGKMAITVIPLEAQHEEQKRLVKTT